MPYLSKAGLKPPMSPSRFELCEGALRKSNGPALLSIGTALGGAAPAPTGVSTTSPEAGAAGPGALAEIESAYPAPARQAIAKPGASVSVARRSVLVEGRDRRAGWLR